MAKIKELSLDERPREKLLQKGAGALSDAELIAILFRTGVKGASAVDVARAALERFGGLTGVFRASTDELKEVKGLDAAKTTALAAAMVVLLVAAVFGAPVFALVGGAPAGIASSA